MSAHGVVWQCSCGAYTPMGRLLCESCGKVFAGPLPDYHRPPAPLHSSKFHSCRVCGRDYWSAKDAQFCCFLSRHREARQ